MVIYETGDCIDEKYRVTGVCNDSGGMGQILHVEPIHEKFSHDIVLKYCRDNEEEWLARFRREVRLLATFEGNSRVVQLMDCNLKHDPPYFVMRYYEAGDLNSLAETIRGDLAAQEVVFLQMIDCLNELHSQNKFHRDIKPANFLLDGDRIVISDLGLSTEIGSMTARTRTSEWRGTVGYMPPEFLDGGFKNPDAPGDIFMLGKTIYELVTGRNPMFIREEGVSSPLLHVIRRCVDVSKEKRYQTLADLKQSLVQAYDVLLGRGGGLSRCRQLITSIKDRLRTEQKYEAAAVAAFVEQLALLDEPDQVQICFELSREFFQAVANDPIPAALPELLAIYEKLVEDGSYNWEYAEKIAKNMSSLFYAPKVPIQSKVRALHLAIRSAEIKNRFAAMDTCTGMITSVTDESLGLEVASILDQNAGTFISNIEPSACACESIRNELRRLRAAQGS